MSTNYPSISVVIPVKNEGKKIRTCIEGILSQTVPVKEIIVVDSGSTDDTLDILKEFDIVKVIEIPGSEFNHGETRNLGINAATGEYALLTVGDAWAYDNNWIQYLLDGFVDDTVAGVCGQQVVAHSPDNNPAQWFRSYSKPEIKKYSFSEDEFHRLSPLEKKKVCGWDDVTAIYRMDYKKEIPFRYTSYAEDAQWAKDAILAGYSIAYNPAARVYHYHLEDPDFSFKRSYTVMYHLYKFFDLIPEMPNYDIMSNLRLINVIRKAEGIPLKDKIKWWRYNISTRNGLIRATKEIRDAIAKGEDFLDAQHQELCGKPPIPVKR